MNRLSRVLESAKFPSKLNRRHRRAIVKAYVDGRGQAVEGFVTNGPGMLVREVRDAAGKLVGAVQTTRRADGRLVGAVQTTRRAVERAEKVRSMGFGS